MPKACPTCGGFRRISRKVQRAWWQVLLRQPATVDELCHTCGGVGLLKGSPKEEAGHSQRVEIERQRRELERQRLAAVWEKRREEENEKKQADMEEAQARELKFKAGYGALVCIECNGRGRNQSNAFCINCEGRGFADWQTALRSLPIVRNSFRDAYASDGDFRDRSNRPYTVVKGVSLDRIIGEVRRRERSSGWLGTEVGSWTWPVDRERTAQHEVCIYRVEEDGFVVVYSGHGASVDGAAR